MPNKSSNKSKVFFNTLFFLLEFSISQNDKLFLLLLWLPGHLCKIDFVNSMDIFAV